MIQLIAIPPQELASVWEQVSPLLQRAIEHSDGDFDLETVYREILGETMHLWAAYNGELKACMVTQFGQYPTKRVCTCVLLGGKDPEEWLPLSATIEEWARLNGADAMEIYGRRGWVKLLDDYQNTYTVLRKNLHG